MTDKLYIDSNELYIKSIELADKIIEYNFCPDVVIGISRGGCFPAIAIHEYLNYKGITCDYHVITAKSYVDIGKNAEISMDISDLTKLALIKKNNILVIDDVFDTGKTLSFILSELNKINYTKLPMFKVGTIFLNQKKIKQKSLQIII